MPEFVSDGGCRIAYQVDDFTDPWVQADTMLLLHPAMSNARRWYRWVPRLARHYHVVRMELRGHGASQMPLPHEDFSLDLLVKDALNLLDELGCGSAHIVGNSAGGYIAQQMAIHHPDRVRTLALYAATPGLKNSHATTWIPRIREVGLRRFLADTIGERFDAGVDPKLVAWFIDQAGSNDPEFIARFVAHMCTHDFMEDLVRIQAPTLIVAAGGEQIGHVDAYVRMQQRIRNAKLVYLPTAGHNIGDGYPDACVDALLDFLQAIDPQVAA